MLKLDQFALVVYLLNEYLARHQKMDCRER
jgi:hypothetical protein